MLFKLRLTAALFLLMMSISAVPAFAQNTVHTFPQIADGQFSDGSYYRSTIMVLPWFDSDTPSCALNFHGLSVTLNGTHASSFTFLILAGNSFSAPTAADQPFASGYATLICS